jgi:hypothetical protein
MEEKGSPSRRVFMRFLLAVSAELSLAAFIPMSQFFLSKKIMASLYLSRSITFARAEVQKEGVEQTTS